MDQAEIYLLYKHKYRAVIPGIERIEEKHIIELWDFLSQGKRDFSFEWDRSEEHQDALRMLLTVWLSDVHKLEVKRAETEERQCPLDFFSFDGC